MLRVRKNWADRIGFHYCGDLHGGVMYAGLCLGTWSLVWHPQ